MFTNIIRKLIPKNFRPIGYLTNLARCRTRCLVHQGPFEGMLYVETSVGSAYIPKLLGTYERELTPQVEAIVAKAPRLIVDIGAAEGYYAVGLARLLPEANIIAFEMESHGRAALSEMAALNNVTARVEIRGKCEVEDLIEVLENADGAVVVCDVEGYEKQLLNPTLVSALSRAVILVELHDFIVPDITELLAERFAETHSIKHIWQESRDRSDFPWRTLGTMMLPQSYIDWAVNEWRPVRMAWFWMEPKSL
jgi:hypothetical protein